MKIKGFTLLELLICISISALLITIGIVSYTSLIEKNELNIIEDELRTAIQYAKNQALILGKTVVLSPVKPTLDWSQGAELGSLNYRARQFESLYSWQWHHPSWIITWVGIHSSNKITFTNNLSHAISNGHFILENSRTHESKVIILNRLGRLREKI